MSYINHDTSCRSEDRLTTRSTFFDFREANGSDAYVAEEYLLPETEAPWPDARVVGECEGVEAAVNMIRIAMEKSGGWKE
jgi:hypothetical protein